MSDNVELKILEQLAATIDDINTGLEPDVLSTWYSLIAENAVHLAPDELKNSISVKQDPVLWMKFEVKCSRRAIPYVTEAIESALPEMPFATRLYFQKVEEIIGKEATKPASAATAPF
jgi:hypothetical protein